MSSNNGRRNKDTFARRALSIFSLLLTMLLAAALVPAAIAANDPGHDTLYILKAGDNMTGSLNVSSNLTANIIKAATLIYGNQLDIRANGSILSVSSRPAMQANANDLYLDSTGNLYLATLGGTGGIVQIGAPGSPSITVNVSGTIKQQGVNVCLSNGTNCPAALDGATGYTKWRLGSNTGTIADITNNTLVNITAGSGITTTLSGSTITIANTGDTNAGDDLTTSSAHNNASTSDINVSGTYNALNLQIGGGKVGQAELATTINLGSGQTIAYSSGTLNANQLFGQGAGYWLNRTGFSAGNITSGVLAISVGGTGSNSAAGARGNLSAAANGTCPSGQFVQNATSGSVQCATPSTADGTGGWTNDSTSTRTTLQTIINSSAQNGALIVQNQTGSTHLFINGSSGNIGIGTTAPNSKLELSGNINASGTIYSGGFQVCTPANGLCANGSSSAGGWTNTSAQTATTLNVGIDTTSPDYQLHIGEAAADAFIVLESTNSNQYDQAIRFKDPGSQWWVGNSFVGGSEHNFGIGRTNAKADLSIANATGNVGIGTPTPGAKLEVVGDILVNNGAADGGNIYLNSAGYSAWTMDNTNGAQRFYYGTTEQVRFYNNGGASIGQGYAGVTAPANGTIIQGNLGIGLTGPSYKLHVVNSGTGATVFVDGSGASDGYALEPQGTFFRTAFTELHFWDWDTGADMVTFNNGSVGIGTALPTGILHINSTATADMLVITNSSGTVFKINSTGEAYSDVGFSTPAADLAERIPVSETVEPGDVLVIDTSKDETLRRSSRAKDRLVAGIASTNPGLRLGAQGIYVALAGRVPVRVTGSVVRGDLLVTSDEPGRAMACHTACEGAVLGKALTNAQDGEVIALVSLQ